MSCNGHANCNEVYGVGYNMTADIYVMDTNYPERDASGEILRTPDRWVFDRTITCMARAAKGTGVRFTPSRESINDGEWMDYEYVMLFHDKPLSKRERVMNIKDSAGNIAWQDFDGQATLFNVNGAIPFLDPFGNVIQYQSVLERVDNDG